MGTRGVTLGTGYTMPEVVGIACLITRVRCTFPPAAMGSLAGMGNTTGMVVIDGPGMRGWFTMVTLKTPEPEALNLAGSPLLMKEAVVVVVASILAVVITGTVMIGVLVVTGDVAVTGGIVVTGGAAVVTTTGAAAVAGMGTNGMGII